MFRKLYPKLWKIAAVAGFSACILNAGELAAQAPNYNPYFMKYGFKPGHWTDSLKWSNIFNINDYQAATMVERYNLARDAAHAAGGGVVYFPAGTYEFENSIQLRSGVIIRGDDPATDDAMSDAYAPPTRFEFPKYIPDIGGAGTPNSTAFKSISAMSESSNIGVVNVDINAGGISIRPSRFTTVQTPKGTTSWNAERNRNYIVFGVRSNNVASPEPTVPDPAGQEPWQRYSSRFASNISVMVYANTVVANNRINDFENNTVHPIRDLSYPQPGYLASRVVNNQTVWVPADSGEAAWFRYTDHHGISVNRKSAVTFGEPHDEPDLFRPGVEILDNWVYKTMRVGIYCSGDGLILKGNKVLDRPNKIIFLHPAGVRWQTNNSATYENRGIDWSGWNVKVENNLVEVFRHRINRWNGYPSVDGEGILIQECCGGTSVNGALIRGNKMGGDIAGGAGYIGLWKMRDLHNVIIDSNDLGESAIIATANTNGAIFSLNSTHVTRNWNVVGIQVDGSRGGSASSITDNLGRGTIRRPCHVLVANNNTFTDADCTPVPNITFPRTSLTSPPDGAFFLNQPTPIELTFDLLEGEADSIHWFHNTRIFARTDGTAGFSNLFTEPLPNGVHRFMVRVYNSTGQWTYSNINAITVCLDCPLSSLEQSVLDRSAVKIYPNPVMNEFHLMGMDGVKQIQVNDLTGKLVGIIIPEEMTGGVYRSAWLPNLGTGVYLVTAINSQGERVTQKVVKQ